MPGYRLCFGRARLCADRLTFFGVGWRTTVRLVVPLAAIQDAVWWTGRTDYNMEIRHDGGGPITLWLEDAGRWKRAIDAQRAALRRRPSPAAGRARIGRLQAL